MIRSKNLSQNARKSAIRHHVNGGNLATAVPQQVHREYFKELHSYLSANKMSMALNSFGTFQMVTGFITGDPDNIISLYNRDYQIGGIYKDMEKNVYFSPLVTDLGYDKEVNLTSGHFVYDVFSSYEWDDELKKYVVTGYLKSFTEDANYSGGKIQNMSWSNEDSWQ